LLLIPGSRLRRYRGRRLLRFSHIRERETRDATAKRGHAYPPNKIAPALT
jgi:hypothetical protein